MNKRAFYYGIAFAVFIIIYKLAILLGGYTFSKFGFYYSNVVGNILIIPFFFACIWHVRNKDYDGFIGGREAIRLAFTVLAVSLIIISIYNYFELGSQAFHDLAVKYYNSEEYLNILRSQRASFPDKLKEENFPKIIDEQINALSPFRASTFKLIPMLFFGLGGAFMAAVTLRRKPQAK
jgi:hypothetical protein